MSGRYFLHFCMAASLVLSIMSIVPAKAGLFGESDADKAARQHVKDQDAAIADLTQRVHDL